MLAKENASITVVRANHANSRLGKHDKEGQEKKKRYSYVDLFEVIFKVADKAGMVVWVQRSTALAEIEGVEVELVLAEGLTDLSLSKNA